MNSDGCDIALDILLCFMFSSVLSALTNFIPVYTGNI